MELQMHSPMIRPALVLGFVLAAGIVPAPAALAQPDLKVRCNQLVSYYARYGSSRGEDTDGNRNFIRLGAEIDCRDGRYEKGIATMEELMKGKNWSVPSGS
jgi:hypothetical protein